jgi:predicted O-methyltransferase YrrM
MSTALLAGALKVIGSAAVRSVEHDSHYASETMRYVRANGLDDKVDLVLAELADVEIDGEVWLWYGSGGFEGLEAIDFLLVDGPPEATGRFARYPALPMLADRFLPGTLVFLDDAAREDEQHIVDRWAHEFPVTVVDRPDLERGGVLIEWDR